MKHTYMDAMRALQYVFDSEQGTVLLEYLEETYAIRSCLNENPQRMAYALGQKEFVETLIRSNNIDLKEHEQFYNSAENG